MVERPDPLQAHRIDVDCIPMLLEFERNGVLVDLAAAEILGGKLDLIMEEAAERTQQLAGARFDVSSDEQYAKILFDYLDLPTAGLKQTKKQQRPSVGAEELAKIEHLHPCIPARKEYKEAQKLKGTYVDKLPRIVGDDNRLRSTFLNGRTTTGRLASKDPNIQNIPARTELGRLVKELFIARPGCRIVEIDYSQIELRCAAHVSADPTMCEVYRSGDDLHWKTAEAVYRKPREELSSREHRTPSKTTNFLTIYEGSAKALLGKLIVNGADRDYWTEELCQELIDGFFRGYPLVREMQQQSHEMLRRYGYVWDMFGRVRRIEAVRSTENHIREEAERQGGNMRIQGACASLIKIAMPRVLSWCQQIERAGAVCKPLWQVHDSLGFEVEECVVDAFTPHACELMNNVAEWLVPIETEGKTGPSWGALKKW